MDTALKYYQGITQQLRGEVDFINSIFEHQGVKGEGNETILRDLITKFIPRKYGVGTGVVIDRHGEQSKQCDIIIYDTVLYPSFMSMTSVHLFPVDIVYAVVEVKTRFTSESAKMAKANIASVKALDYIKNKFMGTRSTQGGIAFTEFTPTSPQGYAFAFDSDTPNFETFKQWFTPGNDNDISLAHSLVGCLDQGLLHFQLSNGDFSTMPEIGHIHKGMLYPLTDANDDPLIISGDKNDFAHNGISHPIKKVHNKHVAVDQGKTLLFFLMFLSEMLATKMINPNISFINEYFSRLMSRFPV